MKKWMLILSAVLFCATQATAQQQPSPGVATPLGEMPQIVAFDNQGLLGDHIHIFGDAKDLGKWGNSISSMVILSGHWEFFDEENFKGTKTELGGIYLESKPAGLKIIVFVDSPCHPESTVRRRLGGGHLSRLAPCPRKHESVPEYTPLIRRLRSVPQLP